MRQPYRQFVIYWGLVFVGLTSTGLFDGLLYRKINRCMAWCSNPQQQQLLNRYNLRGTDLFVASHFTEGFDMEFLDKIRRCCIITGWNLSHFIVHFISGLLFPTLVIEAILLGVTFEALEYQFLNCHDTMDLIMNISGVLLGAALSPYKSKPSKNIHSCVNK